MSAATDTDKSFLHLKVTMPELF